MGGVFLRAAYHHEWLLTNGRGGYALGFGNFLNERKYNGLLVAGLDGFKRVHVLASLEEAVEWRGARFHLDANHYPDTIHPQGYRHIVKSWPRPYPSALYSADPVNPDFLILKELFMIAGVNAVVVKYTNLGAFPINFTIRPKLTLRDHHTVSRPGRWEAEEVEIEFHGDSFSVYKPGLEDEVWGYTESGGMADNRIVFRNVFYPLEAARGYEAVEDLLSPADIHFRLTPGASNRLVFSLGRLEEAVVRAEAAEADYRRLPLPADHPERLKGQPDWLSLIRFNEPVFSHGEYRRILEGAAADFLTEGDCLAGYPWFGPWGRDSLIALSGIRLLKGGRRLAVRILKKYGRAIRNGLLPNTFGEGGQGLNYLSVDAPLWFVLRSFEIAPRDKELFARAGKIVLNYLFNQDLPFFAAEDGLIELREGPWALTWMDAKVYDEPVTPRFGKPVEINALWFNALNGLLKMAEAQGLKGGARLAARPYSISCRDLEDLAGHVKRGLAGFVGDDYRDDYLADRIDASGPVFEIRPNAVIAAGLPFEPWARDVQAMVLETARRELLTPFGLRSLNVGHPAFKNKYLGGQKQRDLAYHQGTVWAWPLAYLARLHLRVHGDKPKRKLIKDLSALIWRFRDGFLKDQIASVAEIWDGLEPTIPKGCPAQAWSVMAVLEIEHLIDGLEGGR